MAKIGPRIPRRRSTPQGPPPPPPKQALLIGIDYTSAPVDSDYPPLHRARSDAKDFRELLVSKYEYRPENVVVMLDEVGVDARLWPTRANIVKEIRRLVHGAQAGGHFVFFYSGHSGQIESPDIDEEDGFDEFIVPVDHSDHPAVGTDEEKTRKRMILDNKLRKILVDPLPVGSYLTAIFDSCHSGTMLDLDHYLCNNVYFPWQTPASRRYKTMWQRVRRRDAQRMSQSGVRIITKKHNSDHNKDRTTPTAAQSRESSCSVRIYQRKRVSEDEIEIMNTSVGVSASTDGRRRQFSVQSRRASVQCRAGSSLAQVIEGLGLAVSTSTDSLNEDGEEFGPRCTSPTSIRTCSGFCDPTDKPPDGAAVLSISSCHDSQLTYESKKGSFTQWLIELLRLEPHQPIGKLIQEITQKMYESAQKRHRWSERRKASWKLKHPNADNDTAAGPSAEEEYKEQERYEREHHPLDDLDFVSVGEPQLGAQHRLDLTQPINL